jgi:methyl-coenzyme M reductase gamma subunit
MATTTFRDPGPDTDTREVADVISSVKNLMNKFPKLGSVKTMANKHRMDGPQDPENRRNRGPAHKLEKLRDVTDEDVVLIMCHCAPCSLYPSCHPPLAEQQTGMPDRNSYCRDRMPKAGYRVRTSSTLTRCTTHPAPTQVIPLVLPLSAAIPGALSGRQNVDAVRGPREKKQRNSSNVLSPRRTGHRGFTVHGHHSVSQRRHDVLHATRCILDKNGGRLSSMSGTSRCSP